MALLARFKFPGLLVGIATAYFITSKLGFLAAATVEQVTFVWPPTGIALAAILLLGYRAWPAIALGAFLTNVTASEPVLVALSIATGNTLEAVTGAWLLHRFIGDGVNLNRLKDACGLLLFGGIISPMVGATIGVTSLCLGGVQPWNTFNTLWFTWWLGDAAGAFIVAPVLLAWLRPFPDAKYTFASAFEALCLSAGAAFYCLQIMLTQIPAGMTRNRLTYFIFLLLIWAALRFGQRATTLFTAYISAVAIWATVHGLGPFANTGNHENFALLNIFMMVVTATGLCLCAIMSERREAEKNLHKTADKLKLIIDNALDAIVSIDQDGRITEWNKQAEIIFGWTESEAVGKSMAELIIPPAYRERHQQGLKRFLTSGVSKIMNKRVEMEALTCTGEVFPIELAVTAQKIGGKYTFTSFIKDISLTRQAGNLKGLLAAIVESSGDAVISKTLDGKITYWNPAAERLFGYTASEVLGQHISLLIPPDRKEEDHYIVSRLLEGKPVINYETIRVSKGGRLINISLTESPIRDSTGKIVGASKTARDISERKMSEQALKDNEAKLMAIVNNTVDGLITIDERGNIENFNPACERIFGYAASEVVGNNVKMLMPDPYHREHDGYLRHYHDTGEKKVIGIGREVEGKRKNGSVFPIDLSVSEVSIGGRKMYSGIVRDITERKEAAKKLQAAHQYLDGVLNHIPDPIFMKDRQHRWIGGNRAFWELMQGPPEKFIGKSDYDVFPKEEADHFWAHDDRVFDSHTVDVSEESFTDAKGEKHVLSTKKTAFLNEEGEQFLVGVIRDISYVKKTEAQLLKYTEDLKRSNQDLDDFAYVASHDLKEPLRGLTILTSLLLEDYRDRLDAEGLRQLQRLSLLSQRMNQLVADLLYYSRIGRAKLALQETDPNAVIDDIKRMIETLIREKGVLINIPHPMPAIHCDKTGLTEVLRNLITNAIKYNDKQEKIIEIGLLGDIQAPHGREKDVFYVRDNGIGIDPQFHTAIFQIFKRLPESQRYDEKGTGVGLTFVKKIVERNHGRVWLESAPGRGTTFYFTMKES